MSCYPIPSLSFNLKRSNQPPQNLVPSTAAVLL